MNQLLENHHCSQKNQFCEVQLGGLTSKLVSAKCTELRKKTMRVDESEKQTSL